MSHEPWMGYRSPASPARLGYSKPCSDSDFWLQVARIIKNWIGLPSFASFKFIKEDWRLDKWSMSPAMNGRRTQFDLENIEHKTATKQELNRTIVLSGAWVAPLPRPMVLRGSGAGARTETTAVFGRRIFMAGPHKGGVFYMTFSLSDWMKIEGRFKNIACLQWWSF